MTHSNNIEEKKGELKIEVIDTYSNEGIWLSSSINGIPIFIPKELQEKPLVQILPFDNIKDCKWIMTKKCITKEEFNSLYPDFHVKQ